MDFAVSMDFPLLPDNVDCGDLMLAIAGECASNIRNLIDRGTELRPEKTRTIMLPPIGKGFSKPLFETGLMMRAIAHKQVDNQTARVYVKHEQYPARIATRERASVVNRRMAESEMGIDTGTLKGTRTVYTDEVAAFHQYGTTRMEAREFMVVTAQTEAAADRRVEQWIESWLDREFGKKTNRITGG